MAAGSGAGRPFYQIDATLRIANRLLFPPARCRVYGGAASHLARELTLRKDCSKCCLVTIPRAVPEVSTSTATWLSDS